MQSKLDDLEAVRTIITALEPFDEPERERIIRWASEKLGIKNYFVKAEHRLENIVKEIKTVLNMTT